MRLRLQHASTAVGWRPAKPLFRTTILDLEMTNELDVPGTEMLAQLHEEHEAVEIEFKTRGYTCSRSGNAGCQRVDRKNWCGKYLSNCALKRFVLCL